MKFFDSSDEANVARAVEFSAVNGEAVMLLSRRPSSDAQLLEDLGCKHISDTWLAYGVSRETGRPWVVQVVRLEVGE